MPLKKGTSERTRFENLRKLLSEGYKQKQALAYSQKREAEKEKKK